MKKSLTLGTFYKRHDWTSEKSGAVSVIERGFLFKTRFRVQIRVQSYNWSDCFSFFNVGPGNPLVVRTTMILFTLTIINAEKVKKIQKEIKESSFCIKSLFCLCNRLRAS